MKTLTALLLAFGLVSTQAYVTTEPLDDFISGGLSGGTEGPSTDFGYWSGQKLVRSQTKEVLHRGKKELILTIDDGPTPGVTDKILDALKKHNVQATFFVIASKLERNRDLFQRMLDEGHIVANHTMTHANLNEIRGFFRSKKMREEILDAHVAISPYMGNSAKFYFRAPYGAWNEKAAKVVNESEYGANYYGPLLWDIGGSMDGNFFKTDAAADWACWSRKYNWSVRKCLRGYINETERKQGGVVLFHDLKKDSAELIERYVEEFANRPDYRFVSLDEVEL